MLLPEVEAAGSVNLPPPLLRKLSFAKFQMPVEVTLIMAPFSMVMPPLVPDHVAVPGRFKVRLERVALGPPRGAVKLMPAFALKVAFVPKVHDIPVMEEQMNPPVQVRGEEKFRTPGADPARVPLVRLTVAVDTVVVPVPKSIVAPLKLTVPRPLIAPF